MKRLYSNAQYLTFAYFKHRMAAEKIDEAIKTYNRLSCWIKEQKLSLDAVNQLHKRIDKELNKKAKEVG